MWDSVYCYFKFLSIVSLAFKMGLHFSQRPLKVVFFKHSNIPYLFFMVDGTDKEDEEIRCVGLFVTVCQDLFQTLW